MSDSENDDGDSMEIDTPIPYNKRNRAIAENLPWVEKYRPSDLDDLISHKQIVSTIQTLISNNNLPHLLFYGPPGTGKTSTILAIAKQLYGKNYQPNILELNASDDRGIDVIREDVKTFAEMRTLTMKNKLKLVILDEADAMTSAAQAALRRVIEKYSKTTRFCIICNYLNKLTPAIQSRCTRFRFAPLNREEVQFRLQQIVQQEKMDITESGLNAVINLGQGDMRKCLNILQSAHMSSPKVTEENVYACTGQPLPSDVSQIVSELLNSDFDTSFKDISQLISIKGLSLTDVITQVHLIIRTVDLPPTCVSYLLEKLAEAEYRLSTGCSEKLNLGAIVGAFQHVKDEIFKD